MPVLPHDPDGALYSYDEQKAMEFADAPDIARVEAQPFLKWAGGKTQLLSQFDNNRELINTYLAIRDDPKELMRRLDEHLAAFNADRQRCYYLVHSRHSGTGVPPVHPASNRKPTGETPVPLPEIIIERAARMIAENRVSQTRLSSTRFTTFHVACFNGLWRVNARGEFNVPIGSHKNPSLYDRDPESMRE